MHKKTYEKASRIIFAALGIAATACIASLITLIIGGVRPEVFEKAEADVDPSDLSSRLKETPDYGQSYVNNVIFLGDKTVCGVTSHELLKGGTDTKQVWTGEKGSLALDFSVSTATVVFPESGESLTVTEAMKRKKPDYTVITLGFENGVAYCNEEKFKDYYGKLIDAIREASPNTKIILQSVFPISKNAEKQLTSITNRKIDEANGWIEKLAEEKGVRYLHTSESLKDKSGALNPSFDSGDGVTLNESGYTAMLHYIRTHGYK